MSVDLKVKISTIGELAGAKAVEAQLERQIGQAKALGKEYGHLAEQLDRVRKVQAQQAAQQQANQSFANKTAGDASDPTASAAAVSRYTAQAGAATAASAGFAGALGKVWGGLRTIAFIIPGLGIAGLIGGLAAAVVWMAKLVIGTDDTKEVFEKFKEKVDAIQESFSESRQKAAEYQISLGLVTAATKSAKDELDEYVKEMDEYYSQTDKLIPKDKELALSRAERITDDVERGRRKLEIEKEFSGFSGSVEREKAAKIQMAKDVTVVNSYNDALEKRAAAAAKVKQLEDAESQSSAKLRALDFQRKDEKELVKESEKMNGIGYYMSLDPYKDQKRESLPQRQKALEFTLSEIEREKARNFAIQKQLESARGQGLKAQETLVNTDPNAVRSAFGRLVSPMAQRSEVNKELEVGNTLRLADSQIMENRRKAEEQKRFEKLSDEKAKAEQDLRRLTLDLSKNSGEALRAARDKLAQINDEMKQFKSAMGSNGRLP